MSAQREANAAFYGDDIEEQVFDQILQMDEDDTEFSEQIVFDFLDQVVSTFKAMQEELDNKNLPELYSLGHFLKGSSATLGFVKIRDACEKIQQYGLQKDSTGEGRIDDKALCLRKIGEAIEDAKSAYEIIKEKMEKYYHTPENPA